MDQQPMYTKPLAAKPIAGMVVILFVATVIGGWLYVDSVRNEMQMKIDALEAEVASQKTPPQPAQENSGRMMEPTAANGWRTVVSANGAYQIDLPPGTKLSENMGGSGGAYVVSDPRSESMSLPMMAIRVVAASEKAQYANQGGHLVEAGDKLYWLYLWEDMAWEPFDLVAASFKVLK